MKMKLLISIMTLTFSISFFGQTTQNTKTNKIKLENLTEDKYKNLIQQDSSVLVDFNAKWCAP